MEAVSKILTHLTDGTIPEDKATRETCGMIAIVYTAFVMHADESGEEVCFHVIDSASMKGKPLQSVSSVWTALSIHRIAKHAKRITAGFKGVDVVSASDSIDVYVAHKRMLSFDCGWCKQCYSSDVNRQRCETSHTNRKKLSQRGEFCVEDLAAHWNSLPTTSRFAIARCATGFLEGVPPEANFSKNVHRIVALAAGKVDLTGGQLMVALDEASEYTFLFRKARPLKTLALYTRGDYVAAMAAVVTDALAEAQSCASAIALLEGMEAETAAAAARARLKQERRERKKFSELEKRVWKSPVSTARWADEDDA